MSVVMSIPDLFCDELGKQILALHIEYLQSGNSLQNNIAYEYIFPYLN